MLGKLARKSANSSICEKIFANTLTQFGFIAGG
jgi:hypothetical protein